MIELFVDEFCTNCPDFEVVQEKHNWDYLGTKEGCHNLYCKHRDKCRKIAENIKREIGRI